MAIPEEETRARVLWGKASVQEAREFIESMESRLATLQLENTERYECIRDAHYWLREMKDDSKGGTHARRILHNMLIAIADKD